MNIINIISNLAMPIIILIIIIWGIIEKKPIFDLFLDGAKEGLEMTIKIFPTLIGIFFAIGLLRSSGIIDFCTKLISPITSILNIPSEIMPLALIKPISGSASIGVGTDIMSKFGVDSYLGKLASVIMGSTETTLYIIAVYTSCIRIKKNRGILAAALTADAIGILASVIICRILS